LNSRKDGVTGVSTVGIVEDQSPPWRLYEPNNPRVYEAGYVAYPDINVLKEMVNVMAASRPFEANISVFNAARTMALQAIEIGS
jgi:flagellar basal-body rod protein FlgC